MPTFRLALVERFFCLDLGFFILPGAPAPGLQRRWYLTFAYGFGFMQWKTTGLAASLAAVTYKVCSLALSLQNLNFSHCLLPKRVSRCREFFLEPFTIGADVSARTRRKVLFFVLIWANREFFLEPFTIGTDVSARTRRKVFFCFDFP